MSTDDPRRGVAIPHASEKRMLLMSHLSQPDPHKKQPGFLRVIWRPVTAVSVAVAHIAASHSPPVLMQVVLEHHRAASPPGEPARPASAGTPVRL
jgi:hypothetical protein